MKPRLASTAQEDVQRLSDTVVALQAELRAKGEAELVRHAKRVCRLLASAMRSARPWHRSCVHANVLAPALESPLLPHKALGRHV